MLRCLSVPCQAKMDQSPEFAAPTEAAPPRHAQYQASRAASCEPF